MNYEKGISMEAAMQSLSGVFNSPDDKVFLAQQAQAVKNTGIRRFQAKSVSLIGEKLEVKMPNHMTVTFSNLHPDTIDINGHTIKLNGISAREYFHSVEHALITEAPTSAWNQFLSSIIPQAHALYAVTVTADMLIAIAGSLFVAGIGSRWLKSYHEANTKRALPSVEEKLAQMTDWCERDKADPNTPYPKSRSFERLRNLALKDRDIFDTVSLKPMGKCNREQLSKFAKAEGSELVEYRIEEACELSKRYLNCMSSFRDQTAPTNQIISSSSLTPLRAEAQK